MFEQVKLDYAYDGLEPHIDALTKILYEVAVCVVSMGSQFCIEIFKIVEEP